MSRSFATALALVFAAAALLLVPGCSSSSSTAEPNTILVGKVLNPGGSLKALGATVPLAAGDPIDVHLLSDPAIRATVAADGSFTLRGLPAGTVTLVFTQTGAEIGRLEFEEVAANQQITINVQLVDSEVVLVDEDRRGIGNAGVELEGLVQNVVVLNPSGDSYFVIAGRSVIARPGVTAIREGNTRRTVADVTVGRRVHVKATTVEGILDLLAFEIKLQGPEDEEEGDGGAEKKMTICHLPGGDPAKAKTLSIGVSAWPAHQKHGDTEGACS